MARAAPSETRWSPGNGWGSEPRTRRALARAECQNNYRHPVLLAKEAAAIDLFSGGRFELGLGAGALLVDYE
jgi:alkanesulfonate monooxygenase SsuD/methylene tetrahydromethanopterin reductase-like flavin-dependent oxidoreductase (luciferase family)